MIDTQLKDNRQLNKKSNLYNKMARERLRR